MGVSCLDHLKRFVSTEYGTGSILIKQNHSIPTKEYYQVYVKALLLQRKNNGVSSLEILYGFFNLYGFLFDYLPSCRRTQICLLFVYCIVYKLE